VRAVLASAPLPTVLDAPRHYKLVSVNLPARQATTYNGPIGFVVVLDGVLDVLSGADHQVLAKGEALLVAAGRNATFKSGAGTPARFLHFVLPTVAELGAPMESRPAAVKELFRTAAPIPGLKPGPYEFTLVRVTFPPHFPPNPPHHRSGAALYYISAGTGMITFGGKTEPRPAGAIQYEPYDFVHHWANPGDKQMVMIQANISHEGVPAVMFVQEAGTSAQK
jgi:quercetin dioxygenase-like cupin family protein